MRATSLLSGQISPDIDLSPVNITRNGSHAIFRFHFGQACDHASSRGNAHDWEPNGPLTGQYWCDIKNDWHLVLGGYREKLTAFGPALYQIGLLTNAWQYAGELPEDVKKRMAEDLLRLWALGKSCHLSGRYISEFGHYALQSEVNPDTPPISMSDLDRLMYSVTNKVVHQGQPQ